MLSSRAAAPLDRGWMAPLGGLFLMAVSLAVVGPEYFPALVVALIGVTVVLLRPAWGVATILVMLLVQYGSGRGLPREGGAAVATLIPGGSGLLTVNNMLGILLAVLAVYRIYRGAGWDFLKSRQIQLILAITSMLILTSLIHPMNWEEMQLFGLRAPAQDPVRLLISRALFLGLFVFFVREPRDLRTIVAIFLVLALATALSASTSAFESGEAWKSRVASYRAGGTGVLIESGANPNRLSMICTLAFVFIWEYARRYGIRWRAWLVLPALLLLVLTIFLSASRGGVLGLLATGMMLTAGSRTTAKGLLLSVGVLLAGFLMVSELLPEQQRERLSSIPGIESDSSAGRGSTERRQYTLVIASQLIRRSPLTGVGYGRWDIERVKIDPTQSASVPHNSYVLALAEGGIFTLVLYLVLFVVTIRQLWSIESNPRLMELASDDGLDWLLRGIRVALGSFLIFSFVADLWELVFLYFLVGIAAVLIHRYQIPDRRMMRFA